MRREFPRKRLIWCPFCCRLCADESRTDEIPCIFPANREFETETGSLETAPSSGESNANLKVDALVHDVLTSRMVRVLQLHFERARGMRFRHAKAHREREHDEPSTSCSCQMKRKHEVLPFGA